MSYDLHELQKAHGRPKWKSLPKHQYTELKPKAEVTFTEYREPFRVPHPDDDLDEDDLDLDDLNDEERAFLAAAEVRALFVSSWNQFLFWF